MKNTLINTLLGLMLLFFSQPNLAATPRIVVTLKPLHSLVSGLCRDVCQPALLLDGTQSPHDYQLKPSERRLLESADMVIYASPNVESFVPSLRSHANQTFIALEKLPGMPLLPARSSAHDEHAHDEHAHHGSMDGHIWLSPVNAKIMVTQLSALLSRSDASHASDYARNRDRLLQKLDTLEASIRQQLLPVKNQPFLQFHDALQYFEHDFELTQGVAVTSGAEHSPGARQLRQLQQHIREKNIRCFFYEPPQAPKLLRTLNVNQNARMQALEIHGTDQNASEDLYFTLLSGIATTIKNCLQP